MRVNMNRDNGPLTFACKKSHFCVVPHLQTLDCISISLAKVCLAPGTDISTISSVIDPMLFYYKNKRIAAFIPNRLHLCA